jgi:lipopolysaccharide/colanic/teichoic acid biosynthesis glycosyltransferase
VVPQALPWETLQSLLAEAAASPNGLRLHVSAGFYDLLTRSPRLSERNHVPLLTVNKVRLTAFEAIVKTSLDYVLAVTLLTLFSPVLAVMAIALRLSGSGSVIVRRPVTGRRGKQFQLLSFRSGRSGVGFIRRLPGLLNVLRGELSLVGPRPIVVSSKGKAQRPETLTIRPGLTGPWREADDAERQDILDLYYIRSYSIWLDLQVLFRRLGVHLRPS